MYNRIMKAGGIDAIAKLAHVPRAAVTAAIRGDEVEPKALAKVTEALDRIENPPTPTPYASAKATLISREDSRGRRAWT